MTKAGMIFSSIAIAALVGTIVVTVNNGGFTDLLSSIATRPSVDRTQTPKNPAAPFQQPEVKQSSAIEPVPAPAQLPAPAPAAPVSNDSASGAKAAPASDKTGRVQSSRAGGRATGADILVPDAGRGTRTALTAEEKAAVARGRQELGIRAANSTPSSSAEQAKTAELNRKSLADNAAEVARAKQLQAQNQR